MGWWGGSIRTASAPAMRQSCKTLHPDSAHKYAPQILNQDIFLGICIFLPYFSVFSSIFSEPRVKNSGPKMDGDSGTTSAGQSSTNLVKIDEVNFSLFKKNYIFLFSGEIDNSGAASSRAQPRERTRSASGDTGSTA